MIFESFPLVLHLQLKRFEYNVQKDTIIKINDRYEFPIEIDLQKYLSPEADRSKRYKYLLHRVIVHSGDSNRGYYYALLKPKKNRKWLKFNDDFIIPVTDKEVLESSYGGEDPNVHLSSAIRASGKNLKQFLNAYMLVYICECNIEDILSPVQPQDIPDHLREYSHLWNGIMTPNTFACHQGFDLTNFNDRKYPLSDILLFNVLKSEAFGNFKVMVAKHFGPDTLITDNFIDMSKIQFFYFFSFRVNFVLILQCITIEEIHKEIASKQNELKLFLEVAYRPINNKIWFPPIEEVNSYIIVFLKYFNSDMQSLDYIRDIIPILCEKKEYPPHTSLKIYEEIKPKMIEELNPNLTFQQSEINHDDIICFQKVLTDEI
ncbi:cysteine proteinase [Gigaspora margarita]|uniref:Cysteine proteinase n=1 Tax=Gigaspora margarita TaxID=4874 RepID=A0A8H4AZ84_GIGMA|nr:cysteine proteinase [Gigaspora margarita]